MTEWQDIATAPKDRPIILFVDGSAIEGEWNNQICADGSRWGPGRWEYVGLPSHGCGCCSSEDPDPTNWLDFTPPQEPAK